MRHHIYVYELRRDGTLSGRRLFASVGIYDGSAPGLGLPDGIKVDTKGRIYVGSPDGVQGWYLSSASMFLRFQVIFTCSLVRIARLFLS